LIVVSVQKCFQAFRFVQIRSDLFKNDVSIQKKRTDIYQSFPRKREKSVLEFPERFAYLKEAGSIYDACKNIVFLRLSLGLTAK
jgi:hypothetical protein